MSAFATAFAATSTAPSQPKALIYRGRAACDGCPEAVAHLLRTSPSNFSVQYAGPEEDVEITAGSLSSVDVFAYPGGPSLDKSWKEMRKHKTAVRNFVSNGGRYLGFCLGAYLAGRPEGFDFLPGKSNTDEEIDQPGAEVKGLENTIIQVDWTFQTGEKKGQTEKRWMFFQDGAVMKLKGEAEDTKVLARYASNGDVAATLTRFGRGGVGLTGPHPEATRDWYTPYNLGNPDGINLDIGYDFVEAVMQCEA